MLSIILYYFAKLLKRMQPCSIRGSFVHKNSRVGAGSEFIDSSMQKNSYCGYSCRILSTQIGSFCSIGSHCTIGLDSHPVSWVTTSPIFTHSSTPGMRKIYTTHPFETRGVTTIGHDVWIGEGVLIKSGVTIGTGAIVGAGSVVTRSIPSYEVWGGVPAKFIKRRFDKNTSEKLLDSAWWSLPDRDLIEASVNINNPRLFLAKVQSVKS